MFQIIHIWIENLLLAGPDQNCDAIQMIRKVRIPTKIIFCIQNEDSFLYFEKEYCSLK